MGGVRLYQTMSGLCGAAGGKMSAQSVKQSTVPTGVQGANRAQQISFRKDHHGAFAHRLFTSFSE